MTIRMEIWFVSLLLLLGVFMGCDSENDDDDAFIANDGAVLFGLSCAGCHGTDGSGGGSGIDVRGATADDIGRAIENPTGSMTALQGQVSVADMQAMANFLAANTHAAGWVDEDNHGEYVEHNGTAVCAVCHGGATLQGAGTAPSCFLCHGRVW